jgi:adenylate kinase family enzyme
MRRVLVVGCSGAGKSTFARALSERLSLPIVHLDVHYWRPDWVETPAREWHPVVERLVAADAWVMDGNFGGTLPMRLARADTAFHLDLPRRACLRGVLGRVLREHGRTRADMAPGCTERFDLAFLRWVWGFRRTDRPRLLEGLAEFARGGGHVVTLRSRRECAGYLASLRSATEAGVPAH